MAIRYSPYVTSTDEAAMEPDTRGDYVNYEDYIALETKLNAIRDAMQEMADSVERCGRAIIKAAS